MHLQHTDLITAGTVQSQQCLGYRMDNRSAGIRSPADVSTPQRPHQLCAYSHTFIPCVPSVLSKQIKRSRREAYHSPTHNAQVRMREAYISSLILSKCGD